MKKGWVYILKCSDGSFYTGVTSDIDARLYQHQHCLGGHYTSSRLPVELIFVEELPTIEEAIRAEKQIKGWTHEKKLALVNHDFDLLVYLSNRKK